MVVGTLCYDTDVIIAYGSRIDRSRAQFSDIGAKKNVLHTY